MRRRQMMFSSLAAPLWAQALSAQSPQTMADPHFFELRWFYLRNGQNAPRMLELLKTHWAAAARRMGSLSVGFFQPLIGEQSPSVLMISAFHSAADAVTAFDRIMQDESFAAAYTQANTPEPAFTGMQATLLRGFRGMPSLVAPPARANNGAHIFELRTYESNTMSSLHTKLEMFNGGEIGIFQRLGMLPVFFGEAIFGQNLPHLTYMLAYEDLATRERLWKEFIADPEFTKLRSKPGYSDAEIVSTISNSLLNPLPFSQIR